MTIKQIQTIILGFIMLLNLFLTENQTFCQYFTPKSILFIAYDNQGNPIRGKTFALTVIIKDVQTRTKVYLHENHFSSSDTNGFINIQIGKGKFFFDSIEAPARPDSTFLLQVQGTEINAGFNRRLFFGMMIQLEQMERPGKRSVETNLQIGDNFTGGVIFYLDNSGKHGKVVSEQDIDGRLPYGCKRTRIFSDSQDDGHINTILITKNCTEKSAASACSNLSIKGYHDWYLPSISELYLIYQELFNISPFVTDFYWSSTECKECLTSRGWGMKFDARGQKVTLDKSTLKYVRAIRKF